MTKADDFCQRRHPAICVYSVHDQKYIQSTEIFEWRNRQNATTAVCSMLKRWVGDECKRRSVDNVRRSIYFYIMFVQAWKLITLLKRNKGFRNHIATLLGLGSATFNPTKNRFLARLCWKIVLVVLGAREGEIKQNMCTS